MHNVTIDTEDAEAVERLTRIIFGPLTSAAGDMAAYLREFAKPPKPNEPQGLGAVVEDDKGERWIKIDVHRNCNDWTPVGAPINPNGHVRPTARWDYADIAAVKVLAVGVTA